MKIKKYVAKSMPEAMNEIRKELGADAVILNSKEIKTGGFLGLFQKKNIEVIAAIEHEPVVKKNIPLEKEKRKEIYDSIPKQQVEHEQVLNEINQLKKLLATQSFQSEHHYPPLFENMYKYFISQEIDEKLAKQLVDKLLERTNSEANLSEEQLTEMIGEEIEKNLEHLSFEGIAEDKQIIQFVGPTGVGKTTTLAKIAASTMLEQNKQIAFITTDTYRIAAIEQLKTYARILDVPVEVAYSIEDYKKALNKFNSYDYIFVDTAGRNFRDERYVNELKNMINYDNLKVETYLVLALTAKAQDIVDIYHQFKNLSIKKIVFTKMDETLTYGSILNMSAIKDIDIAYITNGQDVPDDLLKPTKQMISRLILSRYRDV